MMEDYLSQNDFERLSSFIYGNFGIKMPQSKKSMLKGRLGKRLRALQFTDFSEYCDFLFSEQGLKEELVHLVNAVTTNKTDFFREPTHFSYLREKSVPQLQQMYKYKSGRSLKIWSAGCSTGEEPYTIAMVLSEIQMAQPDFSYEILATDISTKVLEIAKRGIYPMERIGPIDYRYRKKYLLKSRDQKRNEVRIVPELRRKVSFGRLNFMAEQFGLPEVVDIIFCRNVIIYFDKETQEELMNKFCHYLNQGGYLFVGHSESLQGYDTPLSQVAPTIYRKLY